MINRIDEVKECYIVKEIIIRIKIVFRMGGSLLVSFWLIFRVYRGFRKLNINVNNLLGNGCSMWVDSFEKKYKILKNKWKKCLLFLVVR